MSHVRNMKVLNVKLRRTGYAKDVIYSIYIYFADLNVSSAGGPQYPLKLVSEKKRSGQWD